MISDIRLLSKSYDYDTCWHQGLDSRIRNGLYGLETKSNKGTMLEQEEIGSFKLQSLMMTTSGTPTSIARC